MDLGVDLVIDRRERYHLYDMDGQRLIDVHLNGGTYNLGHRHPELVEVLKAGTNRFDMGNHHFPALARTALAESLALCAPNPAMRYAIYGSGGGDVDEIAEAILFLASARSSFMTGQAFVVDGGESL